MPTKRQGPVDMTGAEFKEIGAILINRIAEYMDLVRQKPVTSGLTPAQIVNELGDRSMPENGTSAAAIVDQASDLLFKHSLFNGHPRFMGYITSSAAPLGALADLLADSINPNVGAHVLSPVATAIEQQVIRWIGEFIGVPACFDGILVSGGNMANFTAFFAALHAKMPACKKEGMRDAGTSFIYCAKTTHTWIEKAAALSGLGMNAIRWIPVDNDNRMDISLLEQALREDQSHQLRPIMVIGTAGDVSTGAVDDLQAIANLCQRYDCWFHIDGAYGVPAAVVPEQRSLFAGMAEADSIALDPHKWLYAPLEAGCTLVKDPRHLLHAYSSHPVYYNFNRDDAPEARNYYEYGFQNSRAFRALKVWMLLQQAGRKGYIDMISTDIQLAGRLFQLAERHTELQAITHHLSITNLRYFPPNFPAHQLNQLNELLLNELQRNGEVFLSNAVINDMYCLRACIVNFRTSEADIDDIIDIIVRTGRKVTDMYGIHP